MLCYGRISSTPSSLPSWAKASPPHVAAATLWTSRGRVGAGTGAALLGLALPTFELQLFAPKLYSIDLATSLGGTLFAASLDRALYFTQDVYCTFHLGRGIARFIAGPGVGFTSAFHEDERGVQNGGSLRLVSQLRLELLTNNEAFGFKLLGRPWLEVSHVQAFDDQQFHVHVFVVLTSASAAHAARMGRSLHSM